MKKSSMIRPPSSLRRGPLAALSVAAGIIAAVAPAASAQTVGTGRLGITS